MAPPVAKALLDLLFPPLCIGCRGQVSDAGFCADCWSRVTFLDGPCCACCGLPFGVELGEEMRCAACLATPPAFDSARAILSYDEHSRAAILGFFHADRLELVPGFTRWLGRCGRTLLERCDLVVQMPLHRGRLWQRRYNQAAELARLLARGGGRAGGPGARARGRAAPSQGAVA